MEKTNLILFTHSYPFGAISESSFLINELVCLASHFERIIIVPYTDNDENINLPNELIIDTSMAKTLNQKVTKLDLITSAFFSKMFWNELISKSINTKASLLGIKTLFWTLHTATLISKWLHGFIDKYSLDIQKTIFYTYWLTSVTFGVGMAKYSYPSIKLISRAHGIDLYENLKRTSFIPYRYQTLNFLDRLYLVSKYGYEYISSKYPTLKNKYTISKLGVNNPGHKTETSKDGIYRIASCAFVRPVKRLNLMVLGLQWLAKSQQQYYFEWDHFGGGPMLEDIQKCAQVLPPNVKYHFWGNVTNTRIVKFYKSNPVDVFINTSSSEGIPVSIMEAQSFGIPVVATSVGGVPEIVNNNNGFLLRSDPTPAEISDALWSIVSDTKTINHKKEESRKMWQEYYHADKNFKLFADDVYSLIDN